MSNEEQHDDHAHEHDHPHGPDARRAAWRRGRRFLLVVLLILGVLVFVGDILTAIVLGRSTSSGSHSTVSVTGTGTATGTPNTVSFQVGVSSVAKNASAALAANNARVSKLEAAIIASGVAKKNLQTTGLNIYQNTNDKGVVTGYTADDELSVTLHQISKAGTTLDAATNAAGNGVQLSGLTYSISNQDSLYQKARTSAMKNALAEAKDIAKAAGETVGSIKSVTDQETSTGSTSPVPVEFNTSGAAKSTTPVPVQAGTQTVTDQVSVVYHLNG